VSPSSATAEEVALPLFIDASPNDKIASVLTVTKDQPFSDIFPLHIASIGPPSPVIASKLSIPTDLKLLEEIKTGYLSDPFIKSLEAAIPGTSFIKNQDGFWFIGTRLVIPNITHLREALFYLAHDVLGHFGADKSYAALRESYYWPNMRKQLEEA
jgi:hypothetical protein